jgi:hypothetical protein
MKLSCKYQWGSFLNHQAGWHITVKRGRIALRHAARRQRQSRSNLSLHLQWRSTRQPRINENQERLIEEDHATVYILISWIGWYKECKKEVLLNRPKIMSHSPIEWELKVLSDIKAQVWGRKADSSIDDTTMLFLLLGSCHFGTLVCNPFTHYYFASISLNMLQLPL